MNDYPTVPLGSYEEYPIDEMRELFSEDRWTWPERDPVKSPHPKGDVHELGYILVKK